MSDRKNAYVFVFDGFADWEAALATCEINKNQACNIVTVGPGSHPVTSMGGLRVQPDVSLEEVRADMARIFILPGGDDWEQGANGRVETLVRELHAAGVLIAAICGATLAVARAGLLRGVRHTSNAKDYLKAMAPDYREDEFYVNELAVSDRAIITASGVGSVEFAREIIKALEIYHGRDQQLWFDLFKHGVWKGDSHEPAATPSDARRTE